MEVPGAGTLSPRLLEAILARRTAPGATVPLRFRVIRTDGPFGLVAVEHTDLARARSEWNGPAPPGGPTIRTLRSYGTLRKGKIWVARRGPEGPSPA